MEFQALDRPSGTVTLLFTDVEGSTRLWAADKGLMSASLLLHDAAIRDAIESNSGYVFSTAGDSFAAAFGRASDAVRAASQGQHAMSVASWPGAPLKVRMGLHLGETEERDGDYFGEVVSIAARVAAAGHGGQVLMTDAVRLAASLAAGEVTSLGSAQLRDIAEPMRLCQLGDCLFSPLRVVAAGLSNLPVFPTRLFGRDGEIATIRQLLTTNRLVTVTAVGGSGKSRLVIAVGEEELVHRRSGVWFIDLTAVFNPVDVPGVIASSLGLNLGAGDATMQVIAYLADKEALVILDNCEHVIDACAEFSRAFLTTRSLTSLLTTSRESLGVDGEQSVIAAPLPSDGADSAAVRLFVDRATAIQPQFELTQANAATVAAICARLDGMPLAIELAAARVTVMSPAELLAGLDDRFQLLTGGRRRQRQRTLEATLDWSYDLLGLHEKRVFRSLGVFVDGFDIDAAAAIAGVARSEALDVIDALMAKSLVIRTDHQSSTRFRLLETLKAYAEDRLIDANEAADARHRHLDHYHHRATADGAAIVSDDLPRSRRLQPDRGNITNAFEWAASIGEWVRAGEMLLGSLGAYDLDLAWVELDHLLERAIAHTIPFDIELSEELKACRVNALNLTSDARLLPLVRELRRSPTASIRALAWAFLAYGGAYIGVDAGRINDRAQTEIDQLPTDDRWRTLEAKSYLLAARGFAAAANGDYGRCRTMFEHSLSLFEGNPQAHFGTARSVVAVCRILQGEAHAALDSAPLISAEGVAVTPGDDVQALAHLAMGDLDQAARAIRGHAQRGASGRLVGEAFDSLVLLSALTLAEGDADHARYLLAQLGAPKSMQVNLYSNHLAGQLGTLDEHLQRKQIITRSDQEQFERRTHAIAVLRAEIAARRWN